VNTAVSVRQQAAHEGVAPSLIHRWRKRGMPAELEAGSEWRKRNAARGVSRPATPRPPAPEGPAPAPKAAPPAAAPEPDTDEDPEATRQAETLAERPEEIVIGEKSCLDALKAVRSSRQYCQSRIAACHNRGDEAMAQKWVQTLNAIVTRQQLLEERFRDIMERDGKTMSVETATRVHRSVFSDLRQKLLAAPGSLAAQLNPNDPPHAQGILENWVRLLFKGIHENEPS
jgi:hypothetical protein